MAYRDAKRQLNYTNKTHNQTYFKLEKAFEKYMEAQTQALTNFQDDSQPHLLTEAFQAFRRAKAAHDASREELGTALGTFKVVEIKYAVMIFKGLKRLGLSMKELANVYGIWGSSINRWIRNVETDELKDIYSKEYEL